MTIDLFDVDPDRVLVDGRLCWRWPDGRTFPVIRGGDGPEDPPADPPKNEWKPPTSQEELNRLIEDRLNRDRKDRPTDDELKTLRDKAAKFDEAEVAQMSELERERTLREAAETAAAAAAESLKATKIEAAIIAAAKDAVDPTVVARLIIGDPDNAVTIDDAGQVTGADTAVSTLLKDKPYLAGKRPAPDLGQGSDSETGKPNGVEAGRALYEQRRK